MAVRFIEEQPWGRLLRAHSPFVGLGRELLNPEQPSSSDAPRRPTNPELTLSRGEIVWNGKEPTAQPGRGQFLPCDLPGARQP